MQTKLNLSNHAIFKYLMEEINYRRVNRINSKLITSEKFEN